MMEHFYENLNNSDLVKLALEGEQAAFNVLILRYYPQLLKLTTRLMSSAQEGQDVAQEATLQAYLGLAKLKEPSKFNA